MNPGYRLRSYFITLNTKDCSNPAMPVWHLQDTSLTNIGDASISLHQVFIPNAVYPVNSSNNTILFVETGSTLITASIVPGSYTGTDFATAVALAMTTATLNARTYTASYNMTSTYLLTVTGSGTFYFVSSSAMRSMGITTFTTTLALSDVGDVPLNCAGTSFVDIVVGTSLKTYSSTLNNTTLGRIPLTENFGSYILWEPAFTIEHDLLSTQLNSFELKFQDDRGNLWLLPSGFDVGLTIKISYN